MAEQYRITVVTKSDILPGSGGSRPGVADNDSRYDRYGLPYMNAKTLKGHLREQMSLLLALAPDRYQGADIEDLLGTSDPHSERNRAAKVRVSALTISPVIRNAIADAAAQGKVTADEVAIALSQIRYQTRMDDNGVTKDGTLRQSRQIRKGLEFTAAVETDELNKGERQLLKDAVRAIQHMGTGKSKGLGVVSASITRIQGADAPQPWNTGKASGKAAGGSVAVTGSGKTIIYRIDLTEPVKAGGSGSQDNEETLPYIPGSMIRGSLIGRMLRSGALVNDGPGAGQQSSQGTGASGHQEGNPQNSLENILCNVRFSDILPVVNGEPLFTCPSIYYADKHAIREARRNGAELKARICAPREQRDFDYSPEQNGERDENPPVPLEGEQAIGRGKYASLQNGLSLYSVQMTANLHIKVNPSDMYRYEAIAAGQTYEGVIRCKDEETAELLARSLAGATLYLGGSRSSGYGRCEVQSVRLTSAIGEADRYGLQRKAAGQLLCIYALSNLILLDENGQETSIIDPQLLEERLGIREVKWQRSYTSVHNVNGYNHQWRAGQVQRSAVAAGSMLYYTYEGELDEAKAAALEESGVGLRREDGYGSILVAPDFSGGKERMVVHSLYAENAVDTAEAAVTPEQQQILRYIENRVNQYREDLAIREAALRFTVQHGGEMKRFTMSQRTRLYSMLGRLPQGNRNRAVRNITSFRDNLKAAANSMYQNTLLQIGGSSVSMKEMLNRLTSDEYDLPAFTGQEMDLDHLTLRGSKTMNRNEQAETVFDQKVLFLRLAIYDLMRQGSRGQKRQGGEA